MTSRFEECQQHKCFQLQLFVTFIYFTCIIIHRENSIKKQSYSAMQMEPNSDTDPRAAEREGMERRKSECLCLFSALCNSGAWELGQLGRALRNILSCNVNMSELWSTIGPPSPSQFNMHLVWGVCQWHQEPTFSFPAQGNDPGGKRLFEVLQIKLLCSQLNCSLVGQWHGWLHLWNGFLW